MPLARKDYLGFVPSRRVCRFTMKSGEDVARFAISSEAIDDLAARTGSEIHSDSGYDALFKKFRDLIEVGAERKYFLLAADSRGDSEILLTTEDFE